MKYLFFDIECSNCFQGIGKMCEFGYVLCDENLKVIKADDIPMSPGTGRGSRFHLTGRKGQKDLELAYDYNYYYSQSEFPTFYKQIKKLMEDPDTACFAYSMDNDIPHLHNACTRYKLEPLNYECYDVQKLVAWYLEKKGQMSLHKACVEIVGPASTVKLQEHLSRDDAMMEKLILEAICVLTKMSSEELLKGSNFAKTNSIEFMNRVKEHVARKRNRQKSPGHMLFDSLAIPDNELSKEEYQGRRFNISGELKNDLEALKSAIELIKQKNGVLVHPIGESDYFVVKDEKNKDEVFGKLQRPYRGVVVLKDDLWALKETPIK